MGSFLTNDAAKNDYNSYEFLDNFLILQPGIELNLNHISTKAQTSHA